MFRSSRSIAVVALLTASVVFAQHAPYAQMKDREIKALSPEQIEQYRNGHGMGLALAAELNRYPGPRHVLELSSELQLSQEQAKKVQEIFDSMHSRAVRLGESVIDLERRIERLFAGGEATSKALQGRLEELGRAHAELRFVHLDAHIATRNVLSAEQIERYTHLRGYSEGHQRHGHHH